MRKWFNRNTWWELIILVLTPLAAPKVVGSDPSDLTLLQKCVCFHLTRANVFLKRFPRNVQFIKVKSKRLLFLDQSIARTCFTASDVSLKWWSASASLRVKFYEPQNNHLTNKCPQFSYRWKEKQPFKQTKNSLTFPPFFFLLTQNNTYISPKLPSHPIRGERRQ